MVQGLHIKFPICKVTLKFCYFHITLIINSIDLQKSETLFVELSLYLGHFTHLVQSHLRIEIHIPPRTCESHLSKIYLSIYIIKINSNLRKTLRQLLGYLYHLVIMLRLRQHPSTILIMFIEYRPFRMKFPCLVMPLSFSDKSMPVIASPTAKELAVKTPHLVIY